MKISPEISARVHQPGERAHGVGDVAERARLRPVAVHLDRLAGQRPLDEARDHHPVLAALPRADGVEQADDHRVEPALEVVREREVLVHRLRVGVQPALLRRRPVDAAVAFLERALLAVVAVDLGARGDQDPLAELAAVAEHRLGSLDVRDHRVHGLLDDQAHADRRGQVEDDVALVHDLADDRRREDRVDDEVEVRAVAEVLDVAQRAGRDVVEGEHLPACCEQELGEVRADEAGASGDERLSSHDTQRNERFGRRNRPSSS